MEPTQTHPDKLVDFWEWLVENRTQVSLFIIAAIGIGMIVYVKQVRRFQDEETAAEDFLAASSPDFEIEGATPNLTASGRFQKVADDNPGTAGAINASFLAASSLFDERAYEKAMTAFEQFYSSNPSSALAPAALFGAAASRDAARQAEGAIKGYQSVIAQIPNSPEATQSRVALAKLYLAKSTPDAAKAKALLDQVAKDGQVGMIPGFWDREAVRLSDSLEPKDEAKEEPIKAEIPDTSNNPKESGKPGKQPVKTDSALKEEEKEKK